jgi:hypothetical protein
VASSAAGRGALGRRGTGRAIGPPLPLPPPQSNLTHVGHFCRKRRRRKVATSLMPRTFPRGDPFRVRIRAAAFVPLHAFSAEKAERREGKKHGAGVEKSEGGWGEGREGRERGRKGERGKRGREKGGFRRARGKKSVHPVPRDPSRSLSCDSPVSFVRSTDRPIARSCRSARKRSIRERLSLRLSLSLSLSLCFSFSFFFLTSLFARPVLSCACFLRSLSPSPPRSLSLSLSVCELAYSITGVLCYGIGRVQRPRRTDCIDAISSMASPLLSLSPRSRPPSGIAFQTF